MRHSIFLIAAAALSAGACQQERESNADEVAAETPETVNRAQAPAGVAPVGVATIAVATKEPFGPHLVDSQGRSIYVLEGNRTGAAPAAEPKTCTDACLEAWPPVLTQGVPNAGAQVDSSKLGTVTSRAGVQVTYAGWPLYYYVGDRQPGSTSGHELHDRWGEWYLLAPSGELVGHEE